MATPIKDILDDNLAKAGIKQNVEAAMICDAFPDVAIQVIGEGVRNKVKALYVKNNTLTVAVMSSVIGQELKLHEQEILQKLNQKAGRKLVQSIRFFV